MCAYQFACLCHRAQLCYTIHLLLSCCDQLTFITTQIGVHLGQVDGQVAAVGVPIVPPHKLARREDIPEPLGAEPVWTTRQLCTYLWQPAAWS